jgi:predicted acylesterase/phospholipase RssA
MSRNVSVILASRGWPSEALHVTCVDAYSGERCVVTKASRVPVGRAVAASSAVPGLFAPQPIQDRRCMDGGVSGTGTHLDLLAGARRAVVLGLTDGADVEEGRMTVAPGSTLRELDELRNTGTEWLVDRRRRTPSRCGSSSPEPRRPRRPASEAVRPDLPDRPEKRDGLALRVRSVPQVLRFRPVGTPGRCRPPQ